MGKTVWLVNQYAGSPRHGMQYRPYQLGVRLREMGVDVTVVSGTFSHLFQKQPTARRRSFTEVIDGVRYRWLWVPPYRSPYSLRRFLNMLVFVVQLLRLPKDLPAPDAIVASSPSPFILPMAYLLARRHRARFIVEVRDIWPLTLQELAGLRRWHPLIVLMALCETFAYRTCDYAVSVLPHAESHMRSKGLARGKFRHIPNGINVDGARGPEAIEAPVEASVSIRRFVVGYMGTLSDANGLAALIDSAHLLRENADVHFVLCGRGPAESELKRRSAGLANVTFRSAVSHGEVFDIIRTFDLCYVGFLRSPLYRYGVSPNKLFDYMYAGRPVLLAADVPSSEVERARCGVTVPAEDSHSIARAALELSGRPANELRSMGDRGRAFVLRHHDYRVLAEAYFELL